MNQYFKSAFFLIFLAALGFNAGCSGNQRVESTAAPVAAAPTPMTASSSYTVNRGDTLWSISGKSKVYGDSFAWPLLFKANRDTIQDPDLIEVKQVLKVDKSFSDSEKSHAHQLGVETPKFKSHSQPRATLPLNYF